MTALRQRGFTLIEILLATALLASGLALAFATLRAATATATRGESLAQRSERMRAVEGFLRARLAGTRPVAFGLDEETGLARRFEGEPERMAFVADLPDYLGRGGPYLHALQVAGPPGRKRIEVAFTLVQGGALVEEPQPLAPEVLVEGLAEVRFRYRGLGGGQALGAWQDHWDAPEALPLQVEITIRAADERAAWPPLVVALPLAGSYAIPLGAF